MMIPFSDQAVVENGRIRHVRKDKIYLNIQGLCATNTQSRFSRPEQQIFIRVAAQ